LKLLKATEIKIQTFPISRSCCVPEDPAEFEFTHVEIEYTRGQLYTYMEGRVPELQAATHWKLTDCSITALPPLLSLTGTRISSATLSLLHFIPARKNSVLF